MNCIRYLTNVFREKNLQIIFTKTLDKFVEMWYNTKISAAGTVADALKKP